jgi:acyl carrier protein
MWLFLREHATRDERTPMAAEPDSGQVLITLTRLLREVTGEDSEWAAAITPASRLEGDLRLESVEVAALADRLAETYGERADLLGFLAGLDIDQLIGLTVADVAAYVAGQAARPAGAVSGG